jgi:hypothetical protein
MYYQHPSDQLNHAFSLKPFQGANPEMAKFLFIGLDANYAKEIDRSPIYQPLLEYLEDGVTFWSKYGVHHPFLLPGYGGDGRFYHKTFASIGFTAKYASQVSFAELLHVPTYGRSNLVPEDLDRRHLSSLNSAIVLGQAEYIFIPDGVAKLMRASGQFPWVPKMPESNGNALKIWFKDENKTVYSHYHLSVYGKFQEQKVKQMREISDLVDTVSS